MLTRFLCLCLLIACASGSAAARDAKFGAPGGDGCPEQAVPAGVAAKEQLRPARATAPVREVKSRSGLHGDSNSRPSPRWHSFLPGMFR